MKKLGGMLLAFIASVLFVPSAFAAQETIDFFYGEVSDVTSTKGDIIDDSEVKVSIDHTDDNSVYTFTYDEASLKYVPVDASQKRNMEAAWVGIFIEDARHDAVKANDRFYITSSDKKATVKSYTIDGKKVTVSNSESDWDGYVWFHVTKEDMEKAIRDNGGIYTRKLVVEWENDDKTGNQTITVNVKAAGVKLQSKEEKTLWDEEIYEETVKKVEAEKLAAQQNANKPEEEKQKDSAPKTSDTFPMAFVGIITLGLAGIYTVKKLHE